MNRILVDLVTLTFNQTPRVELFFWAFLQPRSHDSWWESTQPMDPDGIQPDSNMQLAMDRRQCHAGLTGAFKEPWMMRYGWSTFRKLVDQLLEVI